MSKKLTLYYTSDTHSNVFNKLLNCTAEYKKDENTLILDGGDTIQGSPLARYLWQTNQFEKVVPEVFNNSKYDYYTLGNHDFNYGYTGLSKLVNSMNAKCIAANVIDETNALDISSYVIHTLENGLKVGITGIVTDCVNKWESKENLTNLQITDSFTALEKVLPILKEKADITICIYHGGFEDDIETGRNLCQGNENIACKITRKLDFDILLTAHQHMEQEGIYLNGTYVLQLPPNADKYAKIEIVKGDELTITSSLIVPENSVNDELLEKLTPIKLEADESLSQFAGTLNSEILSQEKVDRAVNGSSLADLCNLVQLEMTGADISSTSLANQPVSLPKELTIGDVLRAFPFPNAIMALKMTGEILIKGLERSASYLEKVNSEIVVSDVFLKPKEEHYNYDFFANVEYDINLSLPVGQRVSNVKIKGEKLELDEFYTMALSDYRATGTGGYEFYTECELISTCAKDVQQLVLDYLSNHKELVVPKLSKVNII